MAEYAGVVILKDANRYGAGMQPTIMNFLSKVSQIYGKNIQVVCGTAHDKYTTSGNISDHYEGNAADLNTYGNDTLTGDNIVRAAFIALGVNVNTASIWSKRGALWNLFLNNRRTQIIWRINNVDLGGNHHNHIHIGIRPRNSDDPKDGIIQATNEKGVTQYSLAKINANANQHVDKHVDKTIKLDKGYECSPAWGHPYVC